nr:hypothetical protein GCM10010200_048010 [Actinomadura rugatobispora]
MACCPGSSRDLPTWGPTAIASIAKATNVPFQQALQGVQPLTDIALWPELIVGPWE